MGGETNVAKRLFERWYCLELFIPQWFFGVHAGRVLLCQLRYSCPKPNAFRPPMSQLLVYIHAALIPQAHILFVPGWAALSQIMLWKGRIKLWGLANHLVMETFPRYTPTNFLLNSHRHANYWQGEWENHDWLKLKQIYLSAPYWIILSEQ